MDKRFSWFRQDPAPQPLSPDDARVWMRWRSLPSRESWSLSRIRDGLFRRLNREDIQAIATLFLAITVFMLMTNFAFRLRSQTVFGPHLGADFVTFYNAGKIFLTHPHEKIYDAELQARMWRELFPDHRVEQDFLPYSRAPFLIGIFSALSQVSYPLAYLIWIALGTGLYFWGFQLLWDSLKAIPGEAYHPAALLAASFMPFIVESLAGGQTSALGFFALAAAIAFERRQRMRLSGFVLALLCYQPALLVFVLPMLIVTRRTQTLEGFTLGGLMWGGLSWLLVGTAGMAAYGRTLLFYVAHSTGEAVEFRLWKYIDVNTFFRLLIGERGAIALILAGGVFAVVLVRLLGFWFGAERKSKNYQSLLWAATITWTLAVGLFVGIHDATLLAIAAMLMIHFFYTRAKEGAEPLPADFQLLLVALYLTPWITQPLAKHLGVQAFTPTLICLGMYQFRLLKAARRPPAKPLPQPPPAKPTMNDSVDDW